MFERFTDQARRVVVLAQEEARLLNHPYIGSEHALLGVLAEGHGTGAHTLRSLDVSIEMVRAKVVALVGRGDRAPSGHIPFTPQAKRALEGALREALHAGDHEIGTEHLLLGLIREEDGPGGRVPLRLFTGTIGSIWPAEMKTPLPVRSERPSVSSTSIGRNSIAPRSNSGSMSITVDAMLAPLE